MSDTGLVVRRVEQRGPNGEYRGHFATTKSDAELSAEDAMLAKRREAVVASNLANTVTEQQRREAHALAADAVAFRERWPDPRGALRAAHRQLAELRADLQRRQEVAAAAQAHVERCESAYDAARRLVDGIAAAIVEQLEKGEAPTTPSPTPATADAARQDLEYAMAAKAEVEALIAPAEKAVSAAVAGVKVAARAVIIEEQRKLRGEQALIEARRERIRSRLAQLIAAIEDPPGRWEVPWAPDLARLLDDPEAAIEMA